MPKKMFFFFFSFHLFVWFWVVTTFYCCFDRFFWCLFRTTWIYVWPARKTLSPHIDEFARRCQLLWRKYTQFFFLLSNETSTNQQKKKTKQYGKKGKKNYGIRVENRNKYLNYEHNLTLSSWHSIRCSVKSPNYQFGLATAGPLLFLLTLHSVIRQTGAGKWHNDEKKWQRIKLVFVKLNWHPKEITPVPTFETVRSSLVCQIHLNLKYFFSFHFDDAGVIAGHTIFCHRLRFADFQNGFMSVPHYGQTNSNNNTATVTVIYGIWIEVLLKIKNDTFLERREEFMCSRFGVGLVFKH